MRHTLISILLLVFFVGCGEQELASPEFEAPDTQTQALELSPSWVKPEHATDAQTRSQIGADAALVFFEAIEEHGKADWPAIDAVARIYREQVDLEYRYIVDQFLGREMLRILDEVCTEGCDTTRAFYVERLVEAGHPDAAALEGYLEELAGYWSAEQLRDARRQSAANAEIWLEREQLIASKRECGPTEDCAITNAQEKATRRIIEATRRLQAE